MATTLPLFQGTAPSSPGTYVATGVFVLAAGVAILLLAGGLAYPTSGIDDAAFLLSLVLIALGLGTATAGGVLQWREGRSEVSHLS